MCWNKILNLGNGSEWNTGFKIRDWNIGLKVSEWNTGFKMPEWYTRLVDWNEIPNLISRNEIPDLRYRTNEILDLKYHKEIPKLLVLEWNCFTRKSIGQTN